MTARADFAAVLKGVLEFECCDLSDEELEVILSAADVYWSNGEAAGRHYERRALLDAVRPLTVLMTRADGSDVAAVQWSALLEALGLKP